MAMKSKFLTWCLLLAVGVLAGCTSFNEDKFSDQVKKWAPLGMSLKEARHEMEKHGFDCEFVGKDSMFNHEKTDALDCDKNEVMFHTWSARIYFTDDKVSGYGPMTVE